jgi:hypothetical protein
VQFHNIYKYLAIVGLACAVIGGDAYSRHCAKTKAEVRAAPAQIEAKTQKTPSAFIPQPASVPTQMPGIASTPEYAPTIVSSDETPEREKLTHQLQTIVGDYAAIARPIYDQSPALIQKDDRDKLSYLENEKLADLGKVLSSDELEIYQNHADPASAPRRR